MHENYCKFPSPSSKGGSENSDRKEVAEGRLETIGWDSLRLQLHPHSHPFPSWSLWTDARLGGSVRDEPERLSDPSLDQFRMDFY